MASYQEYPASPAEELNREGVALVRSYLACHADRMAAIADLFDLATIAGDPYSEWELLSADVATEAPDLSDTATAALADEIAISEDLTEEEGTLAHPPAAGSIGGTVTIDGNETGLSDDGEGALIYAGGTGTIDYDTGEYTFTCEDWESAAIEYQSGGLVKIVGRLRIGASNDSSNPSLPTISDGTLEYRSNLGGEYTVQPGEGYLWDSDPAIPVSPDAVPTLRIPIVEHHLIWHLAGSPPWTAIRGAAGCVNDAEFLDAAAETVFCDGCQADREFVLVEGAVALGWRLHYVFREMAIKAGGNTFGWNHRYRPLPVDDPGWDVLVDQHGVYLYRTADFDDLFAVEA